VAFLALHGDFGEDGRVQAILDEAGIPYTGSAPDASSVAYDKVLAKRAYECEGICTPAWMCYEREQIEELGGPGELDLAPPVVVKPACSGSSLGVTIVRHVAQAVQAIQHALEYSDSVMIERFVAGRELSVPVLGEEPLPVIELRVSSEFYDFRAKYRDESTQYLCPADLPRDLTSRVQAAALSAHLAIGCRDLSRTDIILDSHGTPWVLETNSLPGMTSHSLVPKSAATVGTGFRALCEFLILSALRRSGERRAA
jgi:D-alanine-D-alanine ligase